LIGEAEDRRLAWLVHFVGKAEQVLADPFHG
jgi:hypothetical protein